MVYAGRIDEKQKRISDVTRAFCKAAEEVPGTSYTIYGHGSAVPAVKEILNTSGKGLPVRFEGKLKSTEVQAHLLQNQVFVLLSEFEGLPITLMEAMSCGLVSVCTNMRSGISDLITNNTEGILIDDRNGEFVEAIKKLKNNPALWQKMAQAARQKIIASYSVETCSNEWIDLLEELSANAGNKSDLIIPSLKELKNFRLDNEFKEQDNPRPVSVFIPFYKLKFRLGRIKRNIFKHA